VSFVTKKRRVNGVMEENNSQEEYTVDLGELLRIFLRRLRLIVLLTMAFGIIAFLVSKFFVTPLYTASTSLYVNNTRKTVVDSVNSGDLAASQLLAVTYVEMIKSYNVLSDVTKKINSMYEGRLKKELEVEDMASMISASPKNETEILAVYVTSPDPQLSTDIANVIAEVAPDKVKDFVEASSVKIIDQAIIPEKPSSPNVLRNTAIGAFAGLVLGLALAFFLEMFDTRVKSEDDLERMLDYPVIGVIPNIVEQEEENKAGA